MSDSWPVGGDDPLLTALQERYVPSLDKADLAGLLADPRLGRCAVVSSFGAESAVQLHHLQSLGANLPIVFIDTGKHFPETLAYRDRLVERLGLELIIAQPNVQSLASEDPNGNLFGSDPNGCCTIRKTFPLQDTLADFDSWVSGRKRYQGAARASLPLLERDGEKLKINPMVHWSRDEIQAYFEVYDLPRHPLERNGYLSIGCAPCTRPVADGEDVRGGRWADMPDKTECGIHLGPDGRFVRSSRS